MFVLAHGICAPPARFTVRLPGKRSSRSTVIAADRGADPLQCPRRSPGEQGCGCGGATRLVLITCGDPFGESGGHCRDNIVLLTVAAGGTRGRYLSQAAWRTARPHGLPTPHVSPARVTATTISTSA